MSAFGAGPTEPEKGRLLVKGPEAAHLLAMAGMVGGGAVSDADERGKRGRSG